ncbi:MAG TPA: carboxylating nicotinate-nucleotide diphosphorylase [Candidatus Dormibacteraeota bacterium]|nr:carboxylating nicotinate-nucleotide diphosphorylase [Candidatus Dormibacteraeota bacterium]
MTQQTTLPPQLTRAYLEARVREALLEDLGEEGSDVTTDAVVPERLQATAEIHAKSPGVLAGLLVAEEVCRQIDAALILGAELEDGSPLQAGTVIARPRGSLRSLLRAERTLLNFMQQLSGVATLTRRHVDLAPGVEVLDTRKTVPGLRPLQRYAVRCGGGVSHRYNLADAVLIKDNHIDAAGGVGAAVRAARRTGLPVEVEVEDLKQLQLALAEGAETVLLDNMSPEEVGEAVRLTRGRAATEVSGGVSLATIAAYAATGADRISVGALTHSAPALDISMEVTTTWQ